MRKMSWLWIGWLILFLMISVSAPGCSGKKLLLQTEPSGGISQKEIKENASKVTMPSPQKETTISGAVSEVSKPEKLTEPRIPIQQTEIKTQTPASTQIQTSSPPSIPVKPEVPQKGAGFVFNFDNADLYEVIRVMAEIMKLNYIIDPRVKGVVNIHTAGQILAENVFPIFQTILKLNGATAIKKDNLYEIIPFGDAKKMYTPPLTSRESGKLSPDDKYAIQIVSLKYIPVTEVSKLIKPFLSDGADIIEHPPHNIIIIGDVSSNVKKSLDIIELFDIDLFTDLRVRIYPILHSDVTEVAKEMERIFASFEVSVKSARGVGITFTPIIRINSLLAVSSIPNIFEKVEGWLKELDKSPMEEAKLKVFVYYVQNGKAKDLAEVLKQIYVTKKEKKAEFKEKVITPEPTTTPRGVRPSPTPTPSPTPPKEEPEGVPEGEINIVVDETTNALIIRAFPREYKSILETVKKLDLYPKQVLIEVLLAEITLDDSTKFGVEWSKFLDTLSHGQYSQEIILGSTPPSTVPAVTAGIRYSIVEAAGRFSAAISAAATDGRLKVVSSPHILASNNKEAKIQIGISQPVLSTTYTTTATASTNVVEGTIEYKDVGIILTVTPRISDGGLVTLEVNIEDSKVDTTQLGGLSNIPLFRKKIAKTVLSVLEGQMIVIGGLIEDSKNVQKSGVPLLSKIPILGALLGTQEYVDKKTELILLMTPHIITDHIQSRAVTEEFREKVEGIKKELKEKEKKGKK